MLTLQRAVQQKSQPEGPLARHFRDTLGDYVNRLTQTISVPIDIHAFSYEGVPIVLVSSVPGCVTYIY